MLHRYCFELGKEYVRIELKDIGIVQEELIHESFRVSYAKQDGMMC